MSESEPRVFISYSQESKQHMDRVVGLADALTLDGLDVVLDLYETAPDEGWPRWMERNLDEADFVLMICTATYRRRVMGREAPGKGVGARWEGTLIYNRIYNDNLNASRFIPILLMPGGRVSDIPTPLLGHSRYEIERYELSDPGYEGLYAHLTGQKLWQKPEIGLLKKLPTKPQRTVQQEIPPAISIAERLSLLAQRAIQLSWFERTVGIVITCMLLLSPLVNIWFGPPIPLIALWAYLMQALVMLIGFWILNQPGRRRHIAWVSIALMVAAAAAYTWFYWDRVWDLPPRVVTGSEYTPEALDYRAGFKYRESREPSDSEMILNFLRSQESAGLGPEAIVERFWTKDSIHRSYAYILSSWLVMCLTFSFACVSGLVYLGVHHRGGATHEAA